MLVGVWPSVSQRVVFSFPVSAGRDVRRAQPQLARETPGFPWSSSWAEVFAQGHPQWAISRAAGACEATGQGLMEGQGLGLVAEAGRAA